MVNDDHSGSIRVAGDSDISTAETQRRLESFIGGPCPGYQAETEEVQQSNVIAMRRENRQIKRARNARAM